MAAVLSWNLKRRHLDSSQRACIALEILPEFERFAKERMLAGKKVDNPSQKIEQGANDSKASEQAAQRAHTNRQYVSDAKRIRQSAPNVFESVKSGDIPIPLAKQVAKLPESAQQDILNTVAALPEEDKRKVVRETVAAGGDRKSEEHQRSASQKVEQAIAYLQAWR